MADTPDEGASTVSSEMFAALDAPADEPAAPAPTPTPDPAPAPASAPPTPALSAADPAPAVPPSTAAPPEHQAAPEPAAEPPARMVPLATLLEERRKFEERLAAIEARQAAPPPTPPEPEAPAPDWLEDPKGYVDAQMARATKALEKLEKAPPTDPRVTEIAERQANTELTTAIAASQDVFTAKTPDFKEALDFARMARARQIEILNPGTDPRQIVQWIGQEERNLAANLVRQGVNPAERVYQLAQAMGYTPKQAAALATQASPPVSNGSGAKVVDPGLTLNSTPGTTHSEVDDEEVDILAQAQAERFQRPRRN